MFITAKHARTTIKHYYALPAFAATIWVDPTGIF